MNASRLEQVAIVAVALIALAIMSAATRWGLATSNDSARYVRTARNILGTEQMVDAGEPAHGVAHYPPGYPYALAAAGLVTRTDPVNAARWLHLSLFGANVLLVALLVKRFAGPGGAWAALLVTVAPVSIFIHAWLLSEALFVFLSLIAILLLTHHLDRPRWPLLIGVALAASLGMMARYAGAATGPAAIAAILLLDRRPWRQRLRDAAVFTGLFLILPVAWMVRNLRIGGSATNRTVAFHPLSLDHLKDGISTLASWLTPLNVQQPRQDANAHPIVALTAIVVFLAVLVAGIVIARRRDGRRSLLSGVTLLYLASFVTLLILSISCVDFDTPADTRVLSPVFYAWVIIAACAASASRWKPTLIATAIIALLVYGWPASRLVSRLWREGDGFAHAQWQQSPTLAAVRELPADQQIFTNAPGVVYLVTGRQLILTVPSEISGSSRLPNPDYPALMAKIEADLRGGRGVLVYLRRYGQRRAFYPSEEQLRQKLGLHTRVRFSDGAIFDLGSPATGASQVIPF